MDFTKELQAADIIRARGVEGLNEAALLVELRVAKAMMFTHLPGSHNEKMQVLRDAGLLTTAVFSPVSGRAIIYGESSGPIAALEATDRTCVDVSIDGLHIPKWMQGSEVKCVAAGLAPYTEL